MVKLWQVHKLTPGSRSPFDYRDHTEAELDFILEMTALDHPDQGVFIRAGQAPKISKSKLAAAWERVLVGKAHREMIEKWVPPAIANLLKVRWSKQVAPQPVFRPGPAAGSHGAGGPDLNRYTKPGNAVGGEHRPPGEGLQKPRK